MGKEVSVFRSTWRLGALLTILALCCMLHLFSYQHEQIGNIRTELHRLETKHEALRSEHLALERLVENPPMRTEPLVRR